MPTRATVAALRTRPDRVLEDYDRLFDLADARQHLEASVGALRARGLTDLVCVQNKTVVTDAFKGEDLNGYVPIFRAYDIPVKYNFKPEEMSWSVYRPKA